MEKKLNRTILLRSITGLIMLALVGFIAFSCKDDDNPDNNPDGLNVTTIAEGLDTPWEFAFASDGRIFITERPGAVMVIENGKLKSTPWLNLDSIVIEVGESGLTGIALDPDFANNGYVYLAYSYAKSKSPLVIVNKIVRFKENAQTKVPAFDKTLIDGIKGNYIHNVGQLKFGPDGKLYAGVGEIFKPELAQDKADLSGKILRINPDGSVPSDNPFPGSYVYTSGHRNPQGLAFNPDTKKLYATEHGPSDEQGCCMDEINLIEAGKNYGWPLIRGSQTQAGLETPIYYSGDTVTWAPGGATFVSQGEWKGSMLFTGLRGQALYRATFDPNDPRKITKVDRYFHNTYGRLRDVQEGPDGTLYIAVSNYDGRGKPEKNDDRILAIKAGGNLP